MAQNTPRVQIYTRAAKIHSGANVASVHGFREYAVCKVLGRTVHTYCTE